MQDVYFRFITDYLAGKIRNYDHIRHPVKTPYDTLFRMCYGPHTRDAIMSSCSWGGVGEHYEIDLGIWHVQGYVPEDFKRVFNEITSPKPLTDFL